MAIFNPALPDTNDPSYLSHSRGISQPESDKSAVYAGQTEEFRGKKQQHLGEAQQYEGKAEAFEGQGFEALFKGLGDIFTSAVKTADSVIKSEIDAELYSAVDAERTAYTKQLIDTGKTATPAELVPAQGTVQSDELSSQGRRSSVPMEIDEGLKQAEAMTAARANGKMSQTDYIARINQLAQRMRSRFGGHRDYIDAKMAEVSGMNPANALVRSLIQDINATVTAQNAGRNKLESKILQHIDDIPGLQNDYIGWKQGNITDTDILTKINKSLSWKNDIEHRAARLKDRQGWLADTKITDEQNLSEIAGQKINTFFTGMLARIPPSTMRQIQSGEIMDPAEVQKIGQQVLAERANVYQAIYSDALKIGYNKNNSLGAAGVTKIINEQMALFDNFADRLLKGDASAAVAMTKQNDAIVDKTQNQMLTEPGAMGVYMRATSAGRKAGGDFMVQKITQGVLGQGLQSSTEAWLERQLQVLHGNPDPTKPLTPNDILNKAKESGVGIPKVNAIVAKQIDNLADPKIEEEGRLNLLRQYVHPKNYGFVGQFSQDRWNTPDGTYQRGAQFIRGRSDVFANITSPKNIDAVWQLADKHDANLKKQYTDFVQYSFAKDLYQKDIGNLSEIANDKFMQIAWNTSSNKIEVVPNMVAVRSTLATSGPESAMEGIIDQRLRFHQTSVERLNKGVEGLVNLAKKQGIDPDVYVLQTLRDAGVRFDKGGFAEKLTDSMAAVRRKIK